MPESEIYVQDTRDILWEFPMKNIETIIYLHERDVEGFTENLMDIAAALGSLETVKYLQERDLHCTEAAMYYAIVNGHLDIVKYLYYNYNINYEYSMLKIASKYKQIDIIKFCVENKK